MNKSMHSIKHLVIGHVFQTEPSSEQANGMTATRTQATCRRHPIVCYCMQLVSVLHGGIGPELWCSMCCTSGRRMTLTNVQPFLILTLQFQPVAALGMES